MLKTKDTTKTRLDKALVQRGLAPTRSRAKAMLSRGIVCVNHQPTSKANQPITPHDTITLLQQDHPWVSRAGLKLAHALDIFGVCVSDKICLDVGASTGGFTHVLWHHNAHHVYAVDVGTDQLHPTLNNHPRISNIQQTDARHLTRDLIPHAPDIVVCDVSFISLQKVLPPALSLACGGATLIALIKPQFQLTPQAVGRGGIVKDPTLHQQACDEVTEFLTQQNWTVKTIIPSPITGGNGNKEFLCHGVKNIA